jgi:hypothetical protein
MKNIDQAFAHNYSGKRNNSGYSFFPKRRVKKLGQNLLPLLFIPLLLIPIITVWSNSSEDTPNRVAASQQQSRWNTIITATPTIQAPQAQSPGAANSVRINTNENSVRINDGLEIGVGGGPGDDLAVPTVPNSATISN